jgi:hypothetical protein
VSILHHYFPTMHPKQKKDMTEKQNKHKDHTLAAKYPKEY